MPFAIFQRGAIVVLLESTMRDSLFFIQQEVELLQIMMKNINEDHVIKTKVTLLFKRFHYTTVSLTYFFVEEIQQPPINYGVGIEPLFGSM